MIAASLTVPGDDDGRLGRLGILRRGFAADAGWLAAGAGLSGLAAYAYAAVGSRTLGPAGFAPVSVLWSAWAVTAAAVSFPVQHWLIRRLHADGTEAGVRAAIPRLFVIAAVLGSASGFAGWVARDDLFHRGDVIFPIYLGLVTVGAITMGMLRGGLAGRGRFKATALALALENLIRVAGATLAAFAGWGAAGFGAMLIAGFVGVALTWPGALRFAKGASSAGSQLGFLGGIAAGSLLAQLVLTGGPIALALIGGHPAQITSLFVALAVFRAPYLVATGVASRLTGTFTRLAVAEDRRRLRWARASTISGTIAAAAIGAAVGAAVGPSLVRVLFGAGIQLTRPDAAILAAGSAVALGTLVLGLALVGRARSGLMAVSWVIALTVALLWLMAGPGEPLRRVATAFVLGEVVAFVLMVAAEVRADVPGYDGSEG